MSGALAGGFARALVIPLDRGGAKGVRTTIFRRMPQMGCLMMFYTYNAQRVLPGSEKKPSSKLVSTFLVASCAGFNMRLLCNPITRVGDEKLRTGDRTIEVIRRFKSKTILQFWYCAPNLLANALYCGVLLTTFEGLRRFNERNFFPMHPKAIEPASESSTEGLMFKNAHYAATNFVCGGIAAAFASTVCYPYSAHQYLQTVIHDSSLCRGLVPTLVKEVPQVAIALGTFTLLQPLLAPHHGVRCGFGY